MFDLDSVKFGDDSFFMSLIFDISMSFVFDFYKFGNVLCFIKEFKSYGINIYKLLIFKCIGNHISNRDFLC